MEAFITTPHIYSFGDALKYQCRPSLHYSSIATVDTLSTHRPADAHQMQSSAVQFEHVLREAHMAPHPPPTDTLLEQKANLDLLPADRFLVLKWEQIE